MAQCLKVLVATAALLAGNLVLVECYSYYINVNETSGENSIQCLQNDSVSCNTLEWVLNEPTARRSSTKIQLTQGTHYLTRPFPPFQDLNSLAISGSQSVIECKNISTGFSFLNVYNIELHNLTILNCKMIINTTTPMFVPPVDNRMEFYKCYATLYFNLCANVTLDEIEITGNFGAAGLVFHNTIGQNVITHSNFSGSENANVSSLYSGLGGVYIEFTYCLPSVQHCSNTKMNDSMVFFNSHANFSFRHVRFNNNKANIIPGIAINPGMFPHRTMHNSFGKGGGLALIFKRNSSHNLIEIENCLFLHNKAVWGSGMIIEFQDSSYLNTVNIVNTEFHNNGIKDVQEYPTVGGAIRIGHYVLSPPNPYNDMSTNNFTLKDCNITNNTATVGGGISVIQARINDNFNLNLLCSLTRSSFTNNEAYIGSAFEARFYSNKINENPLPILFESLNFTNNNVFNITESLLIKEGEGCIYTYGFPLKFQGENQLLHNNGSALVLSKTAVYFTNSSINFMQNSGKYGGAIKMLQSAYLLINDNTSVRFIKNQASMHGGAIANMNEEKQNVNIYYNCFIQHTGLLLPSDWSANFTFKNNNAMQLGASIFTTSLKSCSWAGIFKYREVFCWKHWIYFRNNTPSECLLEVNTRAANISFDVELHRLNTFPGKLISLNLTVTDELHKNVSSDTVIVVREERNAHNVDSFYSKGHVNMRLYDKENSMSNITLGSLETAYWHTELELHTNSCPPGLELQPLNKRKEKFTCQCKQLKGVQCSSSNFNARLMNGYWLGKFDNGKGWSTGLCPTIFCNWNRTGYLINVTGDELQLRICRRNHNGTLCGLCKTGYGLSVSSRYLSCVPCNNFMIASNVIKYLLSVHVPLLVLFLCLLLFGVRLTSGPAIAFIFFAQTISSTLDPIADHHILVYSRKLEKSIILYKFLYRLFNLELTEHVLNPFCMSTNWNALDVLQLNYLIATFPLLIIFVSIALVKLKYSCKYCRSLKCCSWSKTGSQSLVHVFSTYLLLSYTKFVLTSMSIIKRSHIYHYKSFSSEERVYFAGHYNVTDPHYRWRYQNPAYIILIISSIFPILLFRYPLLFIEKIIGTNCFLAKWYPSDKMHIFLDTFQGCYKDNRRYFAGMYFLFRLLMGAAYFFSSDWFHQYVMQLNLSIIFIFLVALLRPYRKEYWFLNYVDLFVFTNLALVNLSSLYMLSYYVFESRNIRAHQEALHFMMLLVYLPLVWMITYIFWKFFPRKIQKKLRQKIFKWILKAVMTMRRLSSQLDYDEIRDNDACIENSMNATLEQAEGQRSYHSTSSTSTCEASLPDYKKNYFEEKKQQAAENNESEDKES